MPPFPNPPPGRLAVEFVKVNQDWARDVEKWISGFRRYLTDLQEIANVEAHIQSEVKFDWHLSQPLCVKLPGPLINQAQQILNNAMARGEAINAGEITHHGFDNFAGHGGIGSGFGSAQAPQMVQPPPASGFTPNGEVPQYYTPVPGSAPPGFYIPSGGKRVNPKSNESPTPAAKKGRPRGGTGARFSKVRVILFFFIVSC